MHVELPEKLYYSIGEVADAFGVNASLIRFWEKEFDVIKPKKNAKGNRKFTPEDIKKRRAYSSRKFISRESSHGTTMDIKHPKNSYSQCR